VKRRGTAVAGAVLFAAATAALFFVSRGKWSDAIIDSGREWIVPDALSRGQLLYRDVVYWFGPFTPYAHALAFRLFGSSFVTLVAAGAVASVAILAALFLVLRRVAGHRQAAAWTALAVPALVFMPHAGGLLLGMGYRIWHAAGFALAAVLAASAGRRAGPKRPLLAGALAGLSGLCRTEWGLMAEAGCLLALALSRRRARGFPREAIASLGAFAAVLAAGLGFFVLRAGPAAVLRDGHVLLVGMPEETIEFFRVFSGVRDWPKGLAQLAYSAAMWLGAALLVEIVTLSRSRPGIARRRALWLACVVGTLGAAALAGGAWGSVLFSAAPAVSAAAFVVGARRAGRPRAAALAACGFLGLVLSYRRPFHIGDSAYVGPPLLFAFVCAAGLVMHATALHGESSSRRRLFRASLACAFVLIAFAFSGRLLQYASDERVRIAATGGMLSADPETAGALALLSGRIRDASPPHGGLVVIPEGEVLNFLSGRENPLRHKLYIPGYLTRDNEPSVLRELAEARPAVIVLWFRPTGEYGPGSFGNAYGKQIAEWIGNHYAEQVSRSPLTGKATPRLFVERAGALSRQEFIRYPVGIRLP
jgi:hypothetical protein